ncbi:hypothetical protein LSTR_LSTR009591 [Laodelphax striatellus]|uniref:Cytosol aminopeptidase n=1 Tax=Laodelphax striatellus TaxID=195883 RepID=A0A482WQE0_LAOST|nr:hypothetical protein LSTR_LSTR009591 [Laodelphax striatellus]
MNKFLAVLKSLRSIEVSKNLSKCIVPSRNFNGGPGQSTSSGSGLVIGVYESNDKESQQEFTEAGRKIDESSNGVLRELLNKQPIPLGKAQVYSHLGIEGFTHIALAGVGPRNANRLNHTEQLNEERENIRLAAALGVRKIQNRGAGKISVEGFTEPEASAEGSILAAYDYNANLSVDVSPPVISPYEVSDTNSWASGEINAECQNWARHLSHAPANLKLPEMYAEEICEKLTRYDIRVDIRKKDWIRSRNMRACLEAAKSSCHGPILLELSYCGAAAEDGMVAFVGKGNIFDSGALFIKPCKGMYQFRADMAGAAAICAAFQGIARKRIPINIRAAILLYMNMPSPMGLKPGDILQNRNSKYMRASDPDNDCRLVLSEIVDYVGTYVPDIIVGVGTFTRSISDTLGISATGLFTKSYPLFTEFHRAGLESGDRIWRMPLWKHFAELNTKYPDVDLDNRTAKSGGDPSQAAAFLTESLPLDLTCCCPTVRPYVHLDCFGTGLLCQTENEAEPYYRKGVKMGRPTRLLIQFLYHRACLLPKKNKSTEAAVSKA